MPKGSWESERAAFFAERKTAIGGSDAAAIMGLSRWRTAMDVWADKVGIVEPNPEMGMRQFIGLRLEPLIAEMVAARLGRTYRRRHGLIRSKAYPFIGGHVDFVGLEVKTSYSAEGWGPDGTRIEAADKSTWEAAPIDYILQVEHYLYVTGWPMMTLAVLIGHDDLRTYDVERLSLIDPMVEEEVRFWHEHVETGAPPPLDASDGTKAYLRSRFPRALGVQRVATPEETVLIDDVRRAGALVKEAEEAQEGLKNLLKSRIGDDLGLTAPGVNVTWPTITKQPVTNWEAVARAYRLELLELMERDGEDYLANLDTIVSLHTSTPESYRRLNLAYSRRDA